MAQLWRLVPGLQLHCHTWDDETVLFHTLSGDTHLLGAAAMDVLHALAQSPLDTDTLAVQLAAAYGEQDSPSWRDELSELIESLARQSLLEAVPC